MFAIPGTITVRRRVAARDSQTFGVSNRAERTLVSSALLHVIGHAPCQHSWRCSRNALESTHHIATVRLLGWLQRRRAPRKILNGHGVDAEASII